MRLNISPLPQYAFMAQFLVKHRINFTFITIKLKVKIRFCEAAVFYSMNKLLCQMLHIYRRLRSANVALNSEVRTDMLVLLTAEH
jgi:hypothetical protein